MGATTVSTSSRICDLNAQAPEAAFRLYLHLAEHFRRHEGRMRIQAAQHPAYGAVDDALGLHLLHIIRLDVGEDLRKDLEVLIALALERVAIRHHHAGAYAHQNHNDRPRPHWFTPKLPRHRKFPHDGGPFGFQSPELSGRLTAPSPLSTPSGKMLLLSLLP